MPFVKDLKKSNNPLYKFLDAKTKSLQEVIPKPYDILSSADKESLQIHADPKSLTYGSRRNHPALSINYALGVAECTVYILLIKPDNTKIEFEGLSRNPHTQQDIQKLKIIIAEQTGILTALARSYNDFYQAKMQQINCDFISEYLMEKSREATAIVFRPIQKEKSVDRHLTILPNYEESLMSDLHASSVRSFPKEKSAVGKERKTDYYQPMFILDPRGYYNYSWKAELVEVRYSPDITIPGEAGAPKKISSALITPSIRSDSVQKLMQSLTIMLREDLLTPIQNYFRAYLLNGIDLRKKDLLYKDTYNVIKLFNSLRNMMGDPRDPTDVYSNFLSTIRTSLAFDFKLTHTAYCLKERGLSRVFRSRSFSSCGQPQPLFNESSKLLIYRCFPSLLSQASTKRLTAIPTA
jgi:hypothetical protein